MEESKVFSIKQQNAIEYHKNGYNCAQAVVCSFCEDFGIDEEMLFRLSEGFGFGMGMREVCGALSGMFMVIGLENSVGNPQKGEITKADTYKKVREYAQKFQEKNGSMYCRELKAKIDGKQAVSCEQCIADAVALTEEYLLTKKVTKILKEIL